MRDFLGVRNALLRTYRRYLRTVYLVPATAVTGAVLISAGVPVGPVVALVGASGAACLAILLWFVMASRYAPAIEVLAAWDQAAATYWRKEVRAGRRPRDARQATEWLDRHPETAATWCVRIGLLLLLGRIEEVRAAIERAPGDQPIDRFDRRYFEALATWMVTGTADLDGIRAAAKELDDDHVATGVLAFADVESRLALESGRDVWEPFIAARARLPRLPRGADRWASAGRYVGAIGGMTLVAAFVLAVVVRPAGS